MNLKLFEGLEANTSAEKFPQPLFFDRKFHLRFDSEVFKKIRKVSTKNRKNSKT